VLSIIVRGFLATTIYRLVQAREEPVKIYLLVLYFKRNQLRTNERIMKTHTFSRTFLFGMILPLCLAESSHGIEMDWRATTTTTAAKDQLHPDEHQTTTKPVHLSRNNNNNNNHTSGSLPRQVMYSDDGANEDDDTCGVYLAPSTIPGAGLGTFAGKNFKVGDEVTPGDAVVPLRDIAWNNGGDDHTNTFLWGTWNPNCNVSPNAVQLNALDYSLTQ
jgi:hypothetical protein